jgi:CBS domain-containing protein
MTRQDTEGAAPVSQSDPAPRFQVAKSQPTCVLKFARVDTVVSSQQSSTITESVAAFLEKIPPFEFLTPVELRLLARATSLEYFPKDSVIIAAGDRASESLYIVQKGAVKLGLRTQVGKELVLDMRSEGEVFGLLSLMGRDVARLDVVAVEDTFCYSIGAEDAQEMLARHREVSDYLLRTSLTRYMDRSLNELRTQVNLMGNAEQLLYSLSVADVVRHEAAVCAATATVREAARMISQASSGAVFVVGGEGRAVGVVTDRDFTRKVVAGDVSADASVTAIMSNPVTSVEGGERVFQALLMMLGRNIHHILVTDQGRPHGVLTSHDLMLLQGKSPLSLARHIEQQQTLSDLATAQKRVGDLLPLLMREGARASHITRVVAELNDRVIAKILELAEKKLGTPPVPYCWLVMGSEGRREQTFKTDQDNALIYADPQEGNREPVSKYFAAFADFVADALERCGYPRCPGGYMATNPRYRLSLSGWQGTFDIWLEEAEYHATEDALILFDMRPVGGDTGFYDRLWSRIAERMETAGFFKSILAAITISRKPPLGFFRTFVVERTGEHKEELDIKSYGTGPIVDAARLFALDAGVHQTNTVDRLSALQAAGYLEGTTLTDMREAFEFLTLLRLENQLHQAREGQALNNYVSPRKLTHLQKGLLREAFQTVARVQSVIDSRYRTAVWAQRGQ